MNYPDVKVSNEFKRKTGRKLRKEEILSHLTKALKLLHNEKMASITGCSNERYRMYAEWYDRIDDVRLEMAGVI